MITVTDYSVPENILKEAQTNIPLIDISESKTYVTLNKPSNRFFYDPWEIKDEFKDTIWEKVLSTLAVPIGEARIIQLQDGSCYMSHTDIDDRYHLNLEGQYSFLIDIDSQKMFPTVTDGKWYFMNTGFRHVAANFGSVRRVQLVVRKLLNDSELIDPVSVKITPIGKSPRFEFDDIVSPWLHNLDKKKMLRDFNILKDGVSFKIEKSCIKDLESFPSDKFKIGIE